MTKPAHPTRLALSTPAPRSGLRQQPAVRLTALALASAVCLVPAPAGAVADLGDWGSDESQPCPIQEVWFPSDGTTLDVHQDGLLVIPVAILDPSLPADVEAAATVTVWDEGGVEIPGSFVYRADLQLIVWRADVAPPPGARLRVDIYVESWLLIGSGCSEGLNTSASWDAIVLDAAPVASEPALLDLRLHQSWYQQEACCTAGCWKLAPQSTLDFDLEVYAGFPSVPWQIVRANVAPAPTSFDGRTFEHLAPGETRIWSGHYRPDPGPDATICATITVESLVDASVLTVEHCVPASQRTELAPPTEDPPVDCSAPGSPDVVDADATDPPVGDTSIGGDTRRADEGSTPYVEEDRVPARGGEDCSCAVRAADAPARPTPLTALAALGLLALGWARVRARGRR